MRIDPLIQLSRAIEGAIEAAIVPAVLMIAAVLVIATALEIHARASRRRPRPGRKRQTAPRTRVTPAARGAAL